MELWRCLHTHYEVAYITNLDQLCNNLTSARRYIPQDLMFINISLHHEALTILLDRSYNMYMVLAKDYELTMFPEVRGSAG
jgi:hypothetical protein